MMSPDPLHQKGRDSRSHAAYVVRKPEINIMNHDIGGPGTTEDRVMCVVCDVLIGRVFVTTDDRIINR